MKHRILALLIVLAMTLTLCACGATATTTTTVAPETSEADSVEQEVEAVEGIEPMTLTAAISFNETESGALTMKWFCDYVTEATGGAITFDIYYGGTLCARAEELEMLSSGAIDLAWLSTTLYQDQLPLMAFPQSGVNSIADSMDVCKYMLFENEETSELLYQEAYNNNFTYLGGLQAGTSQLCVSTVDISSLEDMKPLKIGIAADGANLIELGITNLISTNNGEGYENLSRGVCDAQNAAFAPAMNLRWYEVAPYFLLFNTYGAGNYFSMNLDTFNSLSPEVQAILEEAAIATMEQSVIIVEDEFNASVEVLLENGGSMKSLSEEESELFYNVQMKINADVCMARAVEQGMADDMYTILTDLAEYCGYEWDYEY